MSACEPLEAWISPDGVTAPSAPEVVEDPLDRGWIRVSFDGVACEVGIGGRAVPLAAAKALSALPREGRLPREAPTSSAHANGSLVEVARIVVSSAWDRDAFPDPRTQVLEGADALRVSLADATRTEWLVAVLHAGNERDPAAMRSAIAAFEDECRKAGRAAEECYAMVARAAEGSAAGAATRALDAFLANHARVRASCDLALASVAGAGPPSFATPDPGVDRSGDPLVALLRLRPTRDAAMARRIALRRGLTPYAPAGSVLFHLGMAGTYLGLVDREATLARLAAPAHGDDRRRLANLVGFRIGHECGRSYAAASQQARDAARALRRQASQDAAPQAPSP